MTGQTGVAVARTATLIVVNPSGNRVRVPVEPVPFNIGRQADNHLVIRDNRASRNHARILYEDGDYYVEDLKSSHGVFVNNVRVQRQKLYNSDRIEFGFPDSYNLIFTLEEDEIHRLLNQFSTPPVASGATGNLAKLRALVDVARALQCGQRDLQVRFWHRPAVPVARHRDPQTFAFLEQQKATLEAGECQRGVHDRGEYVIGR
ncbi:MAG TPA: FHA domain-containing protein [Bryobacteraceae bacterium]|nr:FHA domain-containing protein [Bryobacteraceae bacterium]